MLLFENYLHIRDLNSLGQIITEYLYMKFEKKKDESLSGTEVPREPNIIRMVFYGTCMVFMILQAVIYVIVYKFYQMPFYLICEYFM
jgi:hypothetical protein